MPATSTTDYWQNLRSQVTGLIVDAARAKYVDVETRADDRAIRDTIDAKTGNGGISPLTVVLVVVAAVAGVVLLKRVL